MNKTYDLKTIVLKMQRAEITEKEVYLKLANKIKKEDDKKVLLKIANEEEKHYNIWKTYSNEDIKPSKIKVWLYTLLGVLFGYTFALKFMENKQDAYNIDSNSEFMLELKKEIPDLDIIIKDEDEHERELLGLINEEKLNYVGSMVLGLNDALVEFTGSLAGWTFAMQSNDLITLAGLITGISATLSMASSEYLSSKNEGKDEPLKASIYTGIAYLFTVIILILPYALLPDESYVISLFIMLGLVIVIIAAFNFYISVANDLSFKHKFKEMAFISLGVALISFVIGLLVKQFLGIDV
ncbi:MAG: VIT1/CCC1 transporter family protein [Erysipelotrichales bacterium]